MNGIQSIETVPNDSEYKRLTSAYGELASTLLGSETQTLGPIQITSNPDLIGPADNYVSTETPIEDIDVGAIRQTFHKQGKPLSIAITESPGQEEQIEECIRVYTEKLGIEPHLYHETWLQNFKPINPQMAGELLERAKSQGFELSIKSNSDLGTVGIPHNNDIKDYEKGFIEAFGDDYPLPDSATYARKTLESLESDNLNSYILRFQKGGQLASCATLTVFKSKVDEQSYAYFHGDATSKEHRGFGLQKATIAVRQRILEELEVPPENWIVSVEQNGSSHRNYQKAGFKDVGTTVYVYEPEEETYI